MKITANTDYFRDGKRPSGTTESEVTSSKTSDPLIEFNWTDAQSAHLLRIRQSELFRVVEALKAGLL